MKLQRREKILSAVAAALVLALAVWVFFFSGGGLSYGQLDARREQLAAAVNVKEAEVKAAAVAARRLDEWQRRALPSNTSDARTVYQAWLRQLADRSKFSQLNVDSAGGQARKDIFTLLSFSVRGRTKIDKFVEFLHEFYAAGHLHQIRRLELKPVKDSPELDVVVSVEAMSLPQADRKSELTKEPGDKLRLDKLADYSKAIAERNIFGPRRPPPADPAKTTFVTAIVASGGRRQVWLSERNANQQWTFHEGDSFQIGSLQGTIKTIDSREVTIEVDKKLRRYACGDNLGGGK